MRELSKTQLKAELLAILREVEQTGAGVLITDRGRPVLQIVPHRGAGPDALASFRGALQRYDDPMEPVAEQDWEVSR